MLVAIVGLRSLYMEKEAAMQGGATEVWQRSYEFPFVQRFKLTVAMRHLVHGPPNRAPSRVRPKSPRHRKRCYGTELVNA
jgi:hypothetical protein